METQCQIHRSVVFYKNDSQKKLIEQSIKKIENDMNKKVVTYVRNFEKFYKAEDKHQDYYNEYFINYLIYKKACGREDRLNKIWNK